jgi:hypothetical protein
MTEMFEKRRQPPSKGLRHYVPARELEVRGIAGNATLSRQTTESPSGTGFLRLQKAAQALD